MDNAARRHLGNGTLFALTNGATSFTNLHNFDTRAVNPSGILIASGSVLYERLLARCSPSITSMARALPICLSFRRLRILPLIPMAQETVPVAV